MIYILVKRYNLGFVFFSHGWHQNHRHLVKIFMFCFVFKINIYPSFVYHRRWDLSTRLHSFQTLKTALYAKIFVVNFNVTTNNNRSVYRIKANWNKTIKKNIWKTAVARKSYNQMPILNYIFIYLHVVSCIQNYLFCAVINSYGRFNVEYLCIVLFWMRVYICISRFYPFNSIVNACQHRINVVFV